MAGGISKGTGRLRAATTITIIAGIAIGNATGIATGVTTVIMMIDGKHADGRV